MRFFMVLLLCTTMAMSNAQNWLPVGAGVNFGDVELYSFKDKLFAGGIYTMIDNQPARGIAYWDDKNWKTFLSDGLTYTSVKAFATYKDELYAFGSKYPSPAYGEIIKYDEIQNTWISLPDSEVSLYAGNGAYESGRIKHAVEFNNELYVTGEFDYIGDTPVKNIAKWNGVEWLQVLTNAGYELQVLNITDLEVFDDALILCGSIASTPAESFGGIASWDGTSWSNLDGGLIAVSGISGSSSIHGLAVFQGELYAAGRNTGIPGEEETYAVVKWDGTNWKGVNGFEYNGTRMTALKSFGNYLVIGGSDFFRVVFLYNGTSVKTIGDGFYYSAQSFAEFNKELFAGGLSSNPMTNSIVKLGTIAVTPETDSKYIFFPNPTLGEFMVRYEAIESTQTIISFFNSSGVLVKKETFNDLKGIYLRRFDLIDFPAGAYIIQVQSKGINESKMLLKQ